MGHYDDIFWFGSILQGLVMIAFLVNMWWKKDCSGISLRSQILYALVFTTRHADLGRWHVPVENFFIKGAFLIVTYGTVFSIYKCLSRTYEKEHDKARIDIWIAVCILLGLIFNERWDFFLVVMAISTYIEAVAMIPQFQMTFKTKRIDKHVILYTFGMATYSLLQVLFLCYQTRWYSYSHNGFQIAAATMQFLPYCEFFRRIYPMLGPQDDEAQVTPTKFPFFNNIYHFLRSEKSKNVEGDTENVIPTSGHLASNVSSIVLTPSSLAGVHKEKASLDV